VTEAILDALVARGVRGSMFIQGRWAEAYPDLARRIGRDGHLVGNHSHYHVRAPLLTEAGLASDLAAADDVISEACGVDPRPWVRLPFGAGADDDAIQARLVALGYRHVGWHVDADDWDPAASADDLVARILAGVDDTGDGAVVLMHGWPRPTALVVPRVIDALRDDGWTLVGIDELPGDGPPIGVPWAPDEAVPAVPG
jgi:peptidoglycan-N-acetylglucosamine deacetylase